MIVVRERATAHRFWSYIDVGRTIASRSEVFARTRTLDHSLDDVLHFVPIIRRKCCHVHAEVILYLTYHLVAALASDQADRNSYTSKASGTSNAVKVDLRISISAVVVREVLLCSQYCYNLQPSIHTVVPVCMLAQSNFRKRNDYKPDESTLLKDRTAVNLHNLPRARLSGHQYHATAHW